MERLLTVLLLYKTSLVRQAVHSGADVFTIAATKERCPSINRDTIRTVIRERADEADIENERRGRGVKSGNLGCLNRAYPVNADTHYI